MKFYSIFAGLISFLCLSLSASESPKADVASRFNQSCFANVSLSGYWSIRQITCKAAIELVNKLHAEDRCRKEKISMIQTCIKSSQGVVQCAVYEKDVSCDRASELIAKAQAVCKPE